LLKRSERHAAATGRSTYVSGGTRTAASPPIARSPRGNLVVIATYSALGVKRIVASLDAWQRRHPWGGFPVAVLKKFGEDRGSSLAALIAFYAFFSLFPLLLAFVSILGFVLEGDPSLRDDIVDTALGRIPVIGAQLADEVHPLTGSGIALAVGIAGALWAGLGVTLALGRSFAEIWDVPRMDQPSGLRRRGRGLALLAVIAVLLVASTAATGVAAGGSVGATAERGVAVLASLAGNVLVYLAIFGLLTPRPRGIRDLLPGVAVAAVGSLVLQSVGGWYVDRAISGASATYGTFALVIGLLSWFWLAAHLVLIAVAVNVVRHRRLWPRSLAGELTPADRVALQKSAEAARQDRRQEIAVRFAEAESLASTRPQARDSGR
jgi:membrane protein